MLTVRQEEKSDSPNSLSPESQEIGPEKVSVNKKERGPPDPVLSISLERKAVLPSLADKVALMYYLGRWYDHILRAHRAQTRIAALWFSVSSSPQMSAIGR